MDKVSLHFDGSGCLCFDISLGTEINLVLNVDNRSGIHQHPQSTQMILFVSFLVKISLVELIILLPRNVNIILGYWMIKRFRIISLKKSISTFKISG